MKNNKSLGQHWLKNRAILDEIAELSKYGMKDSDELEGAEDFAETNEADLCVEIGPGLGTLTSSLLRRFDRVTAVEYDKRLAENLPRSFPGKNLEVLNEDILDYDFSTIKEKYVIAGNIPYYITSPIIEKTLTVKNKPVRIVLLIQKEVAERIVSKKETVLSLFVKNRAQVHAGPVVVKEEFTPPPKVDSRVIIMEPLAKPQVGEDVFFLIKAGFKAPRKKLIHNLAGLKGKMKVEEIFGETGIDLDARPGDLNLDMWDRLYRCIHENN